ncbi:MAG: prephenate dehydratase [Zetaproteobacteria bacterium]|nr:prephenate dehydratase [Zetaproteobacteria bacterium]
MSDQPSNKPTNKTSIHNLDDLRQRIDAVDDQIFELIYQRARLAGQVGEFKQDQKNAPFYVPSREAKIIRRLLDRNQHLSEKSHESHIPDEAIHGIYREIIGSCLALEHPMTIAFLGPEGTFTHTAATRQFGTSPNYLSCGNLAQVFDAVEAGRATYGVVPVENAFEGAVTHTMDLFADDDRDVLVCAEVQLSIHHHLFSYAEKLEDIKVVISHPQPLAQCRNWLQAHLPHAEQMEVASTVYAAEMIERAKSENPNNSIGHSAAAIGGYTIVDRSDLPLVQKNIEDFHDNTTRFLVIGKHDSPPSGEDKTALVLSIQDRAGALNDVLASFAKRKVGLSRIESRPSKKRLWEYVFLIDVQGHRDEKNVAEALEEITAFEGISVKLLGSYPVSRML